jgi:hypothetical protein
MRRTIDRGSIVMLPLPLVSETKSIAAFIGLFAGIVVAWVMSRKHETMSEDISSLHYLLVLANGLLTAILFALIF